MVHAPAMPVQHCALVRSTPSPPTGQPDAMTEEPLQLVHPRPSDRDFIHPEATGMPRSDSSRFVEETSPGSFSVTRVLRWEEGRGWVANISDLPRGGDRPTVYCPFCGREGRYAHTDKRRYFRHGNGDVACGQGDLESVLHRRAKAALLVGLQRLREGRMPLRWSRACPRCREVMTSELAPGGSWGCEVDEQLLRLERDIVLDVAAVQDGDTVVGLEVRASHPVPADKLDLVERAGLPLVELNAASLLEEEGGASWTGDGPLPSAVAWRVPGVDHQGLCDDCAARSLRLPEHREPEGPSLVDSLRHLVRMVTRDGMSLRSSCERCERRLARPFLPAGAEVVVISRAPLTVGLMTAEHCLAMALVDSLPEPTGMPLLVLQRHDFERGLWEDGRLVVDVERLQDAGDLDSPGICEECREPSRCAQDLDRIWTTVARHRPELMDTLKRLVEGLLDLPRFALARRDAPFGVQLDRHPEQFADHPTLSPICWRGLNGRVPGVALLEDLTGTKLLPMWSSVEDCLAAPHAAVVRAQVEGTDVTRGVLVLADRLLTMFGSGSDAVSQQQIAWVLESVLDHLQWGGHTCLDMDRDSLARRVFKRRKQAWGDERIAFNGHTTTWVDAALASRHLVRAEHGFALAKDHAAASRLAEAIFCGATAQHEGATTINSPLTLAPSQERAVRTALSRHLSIITGGAGTGKTTVVRAILDSLPNGTHMVVAPTGKAVGRLKQDLDSVAGLRGPVTVAKLLTRPQDLDGVQTLVIDEAGFLDLETADGLFHHIMRLRPNGPDRIVLVGDPNQLDSVGRGAVLRDLLQAYAGAEHVVPRTELTRGYRSDAPITRFANSVLAGRPDLSHIHHVDVVEGDILDEVCALAMQHGYPQSAQVLAPRRRDVADLNRSLQQRCNPNGTPIGRTGIRSGDRVIGIRNRYGALPILNGEAGTVQVHAYGTETGLFFHTDQRRGPFPPSDIGLFGLAYAMTVHKAQGSEWDTVIVALPHTSFVNRALLYTAATRARKNLVLVGPSAAVRAASNRVCPRLTLLQHCLEAVCHQPASRLPQRRTPAAFKKSRDQA